MEPRLFPQVSHSTRMALIAERRKLMNDPEGAKAPADLTNSDRYIFRTKPGSVRQLAHNLDLPPQEESKNYKTIRARWEDRAIKRFGKPGEKRETVLARAERFYQDLQSEDHLNARMVVFTPIRRAHECYFATNDPMIAAYIRDLVKRGVGDFTQVYEQNGRARVVVGTEAFPDTEHGWRMARQYAGTNGITDIKVVSGDEEGA